MHEPRHEDRFLAQRLFGEPQPPVPRDARRERDRRASISRATKQDIPNEVVRAGAETNPALKALVPFLGVDMNASSEKAIRLLGWAPRSAEDAIVASAESLIAFGLLAG